MITIRSVDKGDRAEWLVLWNQYLHFYKQTLPVEVTDPTWNRFFTDHGHKVLLRLTPRQTKRLALQPI